MNIKISIKTVIIIIAVIIGLYIFLNFDYFSYKYKKINEDNYYTILSSISDSKLKSYEKQYLKIAMLNYIMQPQQVYGKSVNALIKEGKSLSKELNNQINNSINMIKN